MKRLAGLALLVVLALSMTGCSKHARAFWTGAAVGVLASNAFCASCEEQVPCEAEVEYVIESPPCEDVEIEYWEETWRD